MKKDKNQLAREHKKKKAKTNLEKTLNPVCVFRVLKRLRWFWWRRGPFDFNNKKRKGEERTFVKDEL